MKKREKKLNASKQWTSFLWYVIPAVIAGLALLAVWPTKKEPVAKAVEVVPDVIRQPSPNTPPYGEREHQLTLEYVRFLSTRIDPARPENSYMPVGMSSRIWWISNMHRRGLMEVACAKVLLNPDGKPMPASALMSNNFKGGKYSIGILGPRLYPFVWNNGNRVPDTVTQEWKNNFATGLAHEVIHLENPKFSLEHPYPTAEQLMEEELRAHIITAREIIRPLRDMGQPVYIEDIQKDNAARTCKYQLPCQDLAGLLQRIK